MKVTYTIADAKLSEFKLGFLKACPVPLDVDNETPIMTENEWIKMQGKRFFMSTYKRGKKRIETEEIVFDETLVS